MPRLLRFSVPVDTGFFTPVQIQARTLTSLTWNALARWLTTFVISPPRMIKERGIGLVVSGFHLEQDEPFTFFDADSLDVCAELYVRGRGTRLLLETSFTAGSLNNHAARVHLTLIPVRIDDPVSLAAEPTVLPSSLLEYFAEDEIDNRPPPRSLLKLRSNIERTSEPLAERAHSFMLHRHLCEVADQWAWYELPCILESTRELLAFEQMENHSILRQCLSNPLQSIVVEFKRPYYWLDHGLLRTKAYALNGRLALVHELLGKSADTDYGIVVEHF